MLEKRAKSKEKKTIMSSWLNHNMLKEILMKEEL